MNLGDDVRASFEKDKADQATKSGASAEARLAHYRSKLADIAQTLPQLAEEVKTKRTPKTYVPLTRMDGSSAIATEDLQALKPDVERLVEQCALNGVVCKVEHRRVAGNLEEAHVLLDWLAKP